MDTLFKIWSTALIVFFLGLASSFIYGIAAYPHVQSDVVTQYGFFWTIIAFFGAFVLTALIGAIVAIWTS